MLDVVRLNEQGLVFALIANPPKRIELVDVLLDAERVERRALPARTPQSSRVRPAPL
ncbi:MAG TPA: hypothetical protein VJ986_07505 [Gaiellaceae bacterium]|nr:hypothetical protein [Gaiellaceae bacterium]